ncbi:MAG: N-acetyllactosaminide 3-alpha-galactosyltransferase [Parcubacteria bacterium C7867-007]|nr:MAG: N-acetyllactosaminide 3-alpha-galactosyltransferase [Parcubacteria bacterium C7867-007]
MKLLYATSLDLPSTRANRLQTMSMASAFAARLGDAFTIGIDRITDSTEVPQYVRQMYEIRSYVLAWKYLSLAKKENVTHIYCREERLLLFLFLYNWIWFHSSVRIIYEIHHLVYVDRPIYKYILQHVPFVISITQQMKNVLVSRGFSADRIFVAADAVDLTMFSIPLEKDTARTRLGLPLDRTIVLYAGTIDEPWKGVDLLYEAATHCNDSYLFVLVGGKPHYVEAFLAAHPSRSNVLMVGYKPHSEIPEYLKAADVLVLPNSARSEISRIATSPMKLFEYMASERPIVASDLPSIREVLNESTAVLVQADNVDALAEGIKTASTDVLATKERIQNAYTAIRDNTWNNRADEILKFIAH